MREVQQLRRTVIITGGSVNDYAVTKDYIKKDDFIICADRGIVHCINMNLSADAWVGDFDSCSFEKYSGSDAAKNSEIIRLVPEKDDTDTEFACMYAQKNGFDEILLVGGCGTRADHTFSNVFLMEKMLDLSVRMTVVNEHNRIRLLRNSDLEITKSRFKYVSVIPISQSAEGVSNTGFKYPLSGETLYRCSSLGVSNELLGKYGKITVAKGTVLVIESVD